MAAAERAYAFAKERILDGRLAGGALITEGDIGANVGVSRTPVREAFLRLETEGLLRLYPKRGALVVPVSPDEVESVMETRMLVERFAIGKIIESDIVLDAAPTELIACQEEFGARGDWQQFVAADREFHRIFVSAAANPILLGLHDSLRDRQTRMNLTALARSADRQRQVLAEHRAWADAVEARDLDGALRMVDQHLGATLALLLGDSSLHDDRETGRSGNRLVGPAGR
jgi:DNA-binding GntR family transcriptional regulator